MIHNLAGAAGIFGHGELSRQAAAIDDCYAEDTSPSPDQIEALEAALAAVVD